MGIDWVWRGLGFGSEVQVEEGRMRMTDDEGRDDNGWTDGIGEYLESAIGTAIRDRIFALIPIDAA